MSIRFDDFYFKTEVRAHKIPSGNKQCSRCWGTGEVVRIYRDPGPNEMTTCPVCEGKGYIQINKTNEIGGNP